MSSIFKDIDGAEIFAEVRMLRSAQPGAILLVEGIADDKRLAQFLDETCETIICHGKRVVLDAVELVVASEIMGVLAMVDSDFDRIIGTLVEEENLIVSDAHDYDLDTALTPALGRLLLEVGDHEKCSALGGAEGVCQIVMDRIKPLSALRYSNVRFNLGYRLSDVAHDEFFNGREVDLSRMIAHVSRGKFSSTEKQKSLGAVIKRVMMLKLDVCQITSGHDFFAALGIMLRDEIGARRAHYTYRSEIETTMRLTFSERDLKSKKFFQKITQWEIANRPYKILRASDFGLAA